MSEFGAELRRRRLAVGMSLAGLATAIHFTKGYLSKVENGKVRVNLDLAEACDRLLDAKGELVALAEEVPTRGRVRRMVGLPVGTRHFVGREPDLESLSSMLLAQGAVRVCAVHGMAGAGKTALAVMAARAAADRFPDGCLFFDLHGHTPGITELTPADVMQRLLFLLDVPGDRVPPDVDGRANLVQDYLRGSRMLLVFDNVRTAGQLQRLLPVVAGCRVLITSRTRLPALDEAWHLQLGMLSAQDAMALFRSVAGDRMPADEDAVRGILTQCGMLPLAIRIAAARFVAGGWTASGFRDRLTAEAGRLTALDDGERSVAAAFAVSYRMLSGAARRLFGLLALHSGGHAEVAAVHALAGLDDIEADRLLDRLHDAHLLTRHAAGRVELHDLMQVFAAQHALPEIEPREQDAAAGRLVRHTLGRIVAVDELLEPHRFRPAHDSPPLRDLPFGDPGNALVWLRDRWPVVVETIELAGTRGMHEACWQLAFVMRAFFYRDKLLEPWLRTHRRALTSAEAIGDLSGAGMILNNLGMVHLELGDAVRAAGCHQRARTCFAEAGDERGETDALSSLAWVRIYQGDPATAAHDLTIVLAVYRRTGRTRNVVIALRGIAIALTALDRFTEALRHAEEARELAQLPVDVLMSINCLAWIHFRAGRFDEANRLYLQAADLAELVDSSYEWARACTGLGNIAASRDDHRIAARWWSEADDHQRELNPLTLGEAAVRIQLATQPRRDDR